MFKTVTKEEFFQHIEEYRAKATLTVGTTTICEPPILHYHDSTLPTQGVRGSADYFFDTEVARIVLDWLGPNSEVGDGDEFYKYKIKELTK